jgi:hypothetical protein
MATEFGADALSGWQASGVGTCYPTGACGLYSGSGFRALAVRAASTSGRWCGEYRQAGSVTPASPVNW